MTSEAAASLPSGEKNQTPLEMAFYQPHHLSGVIALLCQEYGGNADNRRNHFSDFYDHPCQTGRCIRIVALKEDRVVGFQSLFYWPISRDGVTCTSLQSGNTVVSQQTRGQGVFGHMLRYQDKLLDPTKADFLIGFPVEASLPGFVRNKWVHATDLNWFGRIISPLSALRPIYLGGLGQNFQTESPEVVPPAKTSFYGAAQEGEFQQWRAKFRRPGEHFFFHHYDGHRDIQFDLRLEQRGRVKVLVIGGIVATDWTSDLLDQGVRQLIRAAAASRSVTLLAMARNEKIQDGAMAAILKRNFFFRLKPKIHFIVKPLGVRDPALVDAANWQLFRGDIDTW